MFKKKILMSFIISSFFPAFCFASTSPKGSSGLINIPSAYIARDWKTSVGFFNTSDGKSFAGNISLPVGAELAYSRWCLDNKKDTNLFSLKIPVLREQILQPAIAIGLEDIGNQFDRNYYLTASKQGPFGLRLHFGARSGEQINGFFYGLEKQFRLKGTFSKQNLFVPVLNLTLEYDGQHFNYGFYLRNSRGLRVDFAWHAKSFRVGMQVEL